MHIPWMLTTISQGEEWNAGVILATLAFTVVFVILSILAASIKITSKILSLRGKGITKKAISKKVPRAIKPAKPLSTKALAEVAAAVTAMHKSLEAVAAIAAVHHHIITTQKSITLYATSQSLPSLKPWVIVWLNEASYKPEINPYIKEVGWNARNL